MLSVVAARTDGLCGRCHIAAGSPRIGPLELVGRGVKVSIPRGGRKRKRAESASRRESRRLARLAKDRARKRLAAIFPDAYDMLVAEERGNLGLEPWSIDAAVRGGDPLVEIGFAEMMSELEQRGVNV